MNQLLLKDKIIEDRKKKPIKQHIGRSTKNIPEQRFRNVSFEKWPIK
jgi:hypothetical protein